MKKNNALRVAAGLVVAVLLSTCLVSGTYAKYTTRDDSTDTARVANFGVKVTAADGSAFKTTYNNGAVQSENNTDTVVAPGTSGSMTAVKLSGTPEVKVEVKNEATVQLTGWAVDADTYYCPLEVTVGSTTLKGSAYQSTTEFENAIKAAIDGITATYDANTNLSNEAAACPQISWEWKYEGNNDDNDTKLGDAAADGNPSKINISVKTTVTQLNN